MFVDHNLFTINLCHMHSGIGELLNQLDKLFIQLSSVRGNLIDLGAMICNGTHCGLVILESALSKLFCEPSNPFLKLFATIVGHIVVGTSLKQHLSHREKPLPELTYVPTIVLRRRIFQLA